MIKLVRLTAAMALLFASSTHASDCGWIDKLVNVCDAAENAGKVAGEKAAKAVVEASENVFKSVNYFGSLVEDFYSTDKVKQERAARILKGVFGAAFSTPEMKWVVELRFRGLDTTRQNFNAIILKDHVALTEQGLAQAINDANRDDWNPKSVRGNKPPSPGDPSAYKKDLEAIKQDIANRLKAIDESNKGGQNSPLARVCTKELDAKGIKNYGSLNGADAGFMKALSECVRGKEVEMQADAILALADDRVDLRADQLEMSVAWFGQRFITIVIPERDLLAHPDVEIEMTIRDKNNPDVVIPSFDGNPREINPKMLTQLPTYKSIDPSHGGKYKAFTVSIQSS